MRGERYVVQSSTLFQRTLGRISVPIRSSEYQYYSRDYRAIVRRPEFVLGDIHRDRQV
jgi:hypothetical protein